MKKAVALLGTIILMLVLAGCSNEFKFSDQQSDVSWTYEDRVYRSIDMSDCAYEYNEDQMKYLFSVKSGEFDDMSPSYRVYKHKDDEETTYLFVIPKPSIRDMVPYAFVLKVEE